MARTQRPSSSTPVASDQDDDYMTPAEVAADVRMSTPWVYEHIRNGDLPAALIGRKYRILRRDAKVWRAQLHANGRV